jgi:protein-disulfide isomerase
MLVSLLLTWTIACQSADSAGPKAVNAGAPPPAVQAPAANPDEGVVAAWEGGSLTYADIKKDIAMDLLRLEADFLTNRYDAETAALDDQVNTRLLEAEAKKQGLADPGALLKKEVEDKAAAPTEAEIKELYDANARKLRGKTLEEVRPDIERAVRQRKQGERFAVYMADLRKQYGVVVQLPYPNLPRIPVSTDDDPSIGPVDAKITIVQFAEFQCPYCGSARESLDQVQKNYPGQVRFVFRDFPLGFHDRAIPAAVAANCAEKQEKYWEVHDALMTNQRALEDADLERVAREAKLDMDKWQACRKDPAMEAEIKKDMEDGAKAGVTGTPAFFVNGVFLNGALPYERFKAVIDRELASGSAG